MEHIQQRHGRPRHGCGGGAQEEQGRAPRVGAEAPVARPGRPRLGPERELGHGGVLGDRGWAGGASRPEGKGVGRTQGVEGEGMGQSKEREEES